MTVRIENLRGESLESPLLVLEDSPIGSLTTIQLDKKSLLVASADGRIIGVLWTSEIRKRLQARHPIERSRWLDMPIQSLLTDTWVEYENPVDPTSPRDDYVLMFENDELVCINVGDDSFLNTNRVIHVMQNAATDPLTGLTSRSVFERRLSEEWNRSHRVKDSIGVIIVDLDSFKSVNDQFGHLVGDAVIKDVALRIQSGLRSYDVISRFGGDEFVAFCTGLRRGELQIPCERVLDSISSRPFVGESNSFPLSASLGAAIFHEGFDSKTPRDLIDLADQCLYLAKQSNDCAFYWEQPNKGKSESTSLNATATGRSSARNRVHRAPLEAVCS